MFRFSIREICLLTVIVALVLGWFVDRTVLTRTYSTHLREVANRFRIAHDDAHDFAYFGISKGKLLWKNDLPLYERMCEYLNVMDRFGAEMQNRDNYPEDRDLVRPPID